MTRRSNTGNPRNQFRVIAGQWRSRKLSFPGDVETLRPTTDRIRETLFNWLQQKIPGATCLDLFAGSGALAFEACSRHAASVTAVDSSPLATDRLSENCSLLDCHTMKVVNADAMAWLAQHAGGQRFDIVFLDPPYGGKLLEACCGLLASGDYLAPGGLVYLESGSPLEDLVLPEGWQLLRSKRAGQVHYGLCGQSAG